MALSNWDTLAFDENAEPSNGVIESAFGGASAEIYKNWLDVRCKASWQPGKQFSGGIIARIEHGSVGLLDFDVVAIRGPQDSIIVCVESKKWSGDDGEPVIRRMAGIGARGYSDPPEEWIEEQGIDLGPNDLFTMDFERKEPGRPPDFSCKILSIYREDGTVKRHRIPWSVEMKERFTPKWVGVLPETLSEMVKFLRDLYADDREGMAWVDRIERAKPLRVNQGALFFATHLGTDPGATPPGEGGET